MKISVCIATYNGQKYIREQILSILPQLSVNDEVVISDDSSSDSTLSIIEEINDKRIRIYKNSGEQGYTSNFENALKHSDGDVIFLCDQDDVWANDKVQVMLHDLEKADMVISNATVVDSEMKVLYNSFWSISFPHKSFWGNWLRFGYLGCCMCFKKNLLKKALPFPNNHKYATHDNWLCLVGLLYFKVYYESRCLIFYRRHADNTSSGRVKKSNTSLFFKLSYRVYLLWELLKIYR